MELARETIRIQHDGFPDGLLINADEFDASIYTPFDEAQVSASNSTEGDSSKPAASPKKGKAK